MEPEKLNNRGGASFWMNQRERDYPDENSHNVVVESSGSQDVFEERKEEYMNSVKMMGGCVLLAVYRGKMSEGISFNDNNARAVVCVGLPLPNSFVLPIKVKMDYNDEQRKLHHRTDLLPGREWYNQQAYRAIAQALGRCIRHIADYGAIFLLDIRHCDDGSPNNGCPTAHVNLPKNSTGRSPMFFQYSSSNTEILGGWNGLKPELHKFFKAAKPYAAGVLSKSKEKMSASPCQPLPPKATTSQPCPPSARQDRQSNVVDGGSTAPPQSAAKASIANKQPSVPSRASSTSNNTLQAMFQKQRETTSTNEEAARGIAKSRTADRRASSDDESSLNAAAPNETAPAAASTAHVFKRSPFAEEAAAPAEGAVPVVAPQQGTQSSAIEEEHLCVVCEDAKKSVIIMPCKHMCLCANCADFDRIKECPMCRAKVEDSMTVYW
ncbi:hypothetical protein QTG54_002890 [Skeletonema marinoi]|uniref:RING-type domain-containing protein n=1 Tax=Skeletonema marinoi TaxID=267567 RepID=A0AAD8YHT7_9STRA|nr:hypothetical protein QTG54_002890 [Skeletonema marinoi]